MRKAVQLSKDLYEIIATDQFLNSVSVYADKFKVTNGYGRWLAEYRRMDENGMFEPEELREQYIEILLGTSTLSYICWDAVNYICLQAFDATKALIAANTFEVRLITGEIAFGDNDEELKNLSMKEALSICDLMNKEAEEILFKVYNSSTNKYIKAYGQKI